MPQIITIFSSLKLIYTYFCFSERLINKDNKPNHKKRIAKCLLNLVHFLRLTKKLQEIEMPNKRKSHYKYYLNKGYLIQNDKNKIKKWLSNNKLMNK